MSLKALDPDLKINMTLDEIIHLTKPSLNCRKNKSSKRTRKRTKKRKGQASDCNDHSVPLMSSLGGGYIMVSKKSPLLSAANRRRIATAVSNRQMNSELIENAKEIIPAKYKLVKTDCGVERVLVPAEGIPPSVKLILSKILKNAKQIHQNQNMRLPNLMNIPIQQPRPLQNPPPLISNYSSNDAPTKMDVDDDSEVQVIDFVSGNKTNPPVIDVESEFEIDPNEVKNIVSAAKPSGPKTLNERFRQLSNC